MKQSPEGKHPMKATVPDIEALKAVSPAALSAYARAAGWSRVETYGDHSDVYAARGRPEIVLPRTERLGDYTEVVSRLIEIFADAAETDELSLYRDLVTADRDVIRVRAAENGDGAVAVNDGLHLLRGARDLLLAAACSLRHPRPLYRADSNREAAKHVQRIRLGQTEQGSFTVTLVTPVVPPPMQPALGALADDWIPEDDPVERQITIRLTGALAAARAATERTVSGTGDAFFDAFGQGVSADLCEALVTLISPFPSLDISVTWARTLPRWTARETIRFGRTDAPILREAARSFRNRQPQPDARVFGIVQRLKRHEAETDGNITLRASIDGRNQSVTALLEQFDYERAIRAHQAKAPIVMEGDLERVGQRWRLLNARVVDIISTEDEVDGG